MTPEQQAVTLDAALKIAATIHDVDPDVVLFLLSEGHHGKFYIADIRTKADRQYLMATPNAEVRATITDDCHYSNLNKPTLDTLRKKLDEAFSASPQTLNPFDLGDILNSLSKTDDD